MPQKKAVHFGGGNIGRGFVAEFLHNSGYEVVFLDVIPDLINKLQSVNSYTVTEVGPKGEHTFEIKNYRAINSKENEAQAIDEIASAEIVTCAVGPNILKFIAPVIAKAIDKRTEEEPLAVIACENAIGATDTLAGFIKEKLETSESDLPKKARFANSAIDRIVPNQKPDAGLNVTIEEFSEWCVDKTPFKGTKNGHPKIDKVHFVDDLVPFIERKLFTVNTGHTTAAYYGHHFKKQYIHNAMEDQKIHDIVQEVLRETSELIVNKHGITESDQKEYVKKIITRISNPLLEDVVERVGRAPLRKLTRKERFVAPASELAKEGKKVDGLLGVIEMALRFQNVEGDDESKELAKILKSHSAPEATEKLCGLKSGDDLYDRVVKIVEKVQSSS